MTTAGVRVAIVDDHEAVRFGFEAICRKFGFVLVGSSSTVPDLIEEIRGQDCHVVVTDLSLEDGSQVSQNISALVELGPAVLVFSIADKPSLIRAAVQSGATAIVPKSQSMAQLARAIELAAQGVILNNVETISQIDADAAFKYASLSDREIEVVALYAAGMSMKQVAFALNIKQSSVKEHIDRVRVKYAKLGREAGTKIDLFRRAVEDGILESDLL
jgi:DNA-binding NarL/FixJ family response regulator